MNKLTYDQWKRGNHAVIAPGVREALESAHHGINVDEEIEQLLRQMYIDYIGDPVAPEVKND